MTKFRWDPATGKRHVYSADETPPEHFLPCHPADPEREAKTGQTAPFETAEDEQPAVDKSGGMTKAEVIGALKAGGVEVNTAASKAALVDQLVEALTDSLIGRGLDVEPNATARELLNKATAAAHEEASGPVPTGDMYAPQS